MNTEPSIRPRRDAYCASAVAGGGNCGAGAAASVFGDYAGSKFGGPGRFTGAGLVASAIVGGTAALIGGV